MGKPHRQRYSGHLLGAMSRFVRGRRAAGCIFLLRARTVGSYYLVRSISGCGTSTCFEHKAIVSDYLGRVAPTCGNCYGSVAMLQLERRARVTVSPESPH